MSDTSRETPERWVLRTELVWAFGVGVLVAADDHHNRVHGTDPQHQSAEQCRES
jgi:hypothetical protein